MNPLWKSCEVLCINKLSSPCLPRSCLPHRRSSYDKMTFENFYHGLALHSNFQGLLHGQSSLSRPSPGVGGNVGHRAAGKEGPGTSKRDFFYNLWQAQTLGCQEQHRNFDQFDEMLLTSKPRGWLGSSDAQNMFRGRCPRHGYATLFAVTSPWVCTAVRLPV